MRIEIPQDNYIKKLEINTSDLEVEFASKKKVALVFISLNDRYWPYLAQVIKDCRQNFLPQHKVDYFAWTDYEPEAKNKQVEKLKGLLKQPPEQSIPQILNKLTEYVRLYEQFHPAEVLALIKGLEQKDLIFKKQGNQYVIETHHAATQDDAAILVSVIESIITKGYAEMGTSLEGVNIIETEPVEWPAPTLMRYHLFLNEKERLSTYDYIFYLDADMRVVAKISDEILNEGLLAAEHPMYSLRKQYIPPYEPNPASQAYIKRTGRVVDEAGKPRFKPYYYAGGFQGGIASKFIEAMETMKKSIDKDFDNNYIAIWNDESHWNKYLSDYEGELAVMSPSYIYPDSLIKEYYEPIWGCSYEPKIITLTKPFSLSLEGAEEINKFIGK